MTMLFWKNTLKCYKENLGVEPGIFLLSMCTYGMGMTDLVVRRSLTLSVSLGANF